MGNGLSGKIAEGRMNGPKDVNRQAIPKPVKVLLVEKDPAEVRLFRDSLAEAGDDQFALTWAGQLFETINCLDKAQFDIVMLDPSLPDSQGFDTFVRVRMRAPKVPIILLSTADDEELAVRALQNGAQDCLIKGQLESGSLTRSIRYAIERHRVMADLELARQEEHRLAYFDALTDLPNRQLFYDRLNQALSHALRNNEKLALMFIDLDGFKTVNDSMGHASGDLLLQAVARRLTNCLRKSDTVARMGGDEFTCILPDIKKSGDISVVAQKIIRALSSPFNINGNRIHISGSIGASTYPDDAGDVDALIKNADIAMYDAKKQGKNNFQFFAGSTGAIVPKCILSGKNLNNALEQRDVPAFIEVGKQSAR